MNELDHVTDALVGLARTIAAAALLAHSKNNDVLRAALRVLEAELTEPEGFSQ